MRTAARVFFVATAAAGCLALATMGTNCGGSNGERPSGSGGTPSVGGSNLGGSTGPGAGGATGAGGTSASMAICTNNFSLDCSAAVVPSNVTNGGVTDFTDWNNCGRWGSNPGLFGAIYKYASTGSTMNDPKIEGTPKGFHMTGSVASSGYGGAGLSFYDCATVALFTQVQFTISATAAGTARGCDLELQIKTFDQQPTDQTPAGGCISATTSCYGFPVAKKVAVPSTTAQVITTPLSSFSNWSTANANQVVGLQWQFTGTQLDPDAGAGCPIDVTITDIKFLP